MTEYGSVEELTSGGVKYFNKDDGYRLSTDDDTTTIGS